MTFNLKVSVVIPACNSSSTIRSAIESVHSQNYKEFEIIVIDDGSSDNTRGVLAEFASIKYLYQENQGPSAARNRGVREASGDLIAFLDADDIWLPEKLELQVQAFNKNPRLGLCATASYFCDEHFGNRRLNDAKLKDHRQIRRGLIEKNLFPTPTVMVRRECFEKVGLFDESIRYGEDWDMWLRVASEYETAYISVPLCCYRTLEAGITTSRFIENAREWENLIQIIKSRHNDFYTQHIGHRKSLSWFFLNCSYYYQTEKQYELSASLLARSIISWPYNMYFRYNRLFKICLGHVFTGYIYKYYKSFSK